MKKIIIILMACMLLFLTGGMLFKHNFGRSYHHRVTKSTDLSKENMAGLYLGDKRNSDKIISQYGEMTESGWENLAYHYYHLSDGIEVATLKNDDKIIRLKVTDKGVKSEKGISVGDSKEKAITAYGKHYYSRLEQGSDIIGYVDKENGCSIEFWLAEDGIGMIKLDYSYMDKGEFV